MFTEILTERSSLRNLEVSDGARIFEYPILLASRLPRATLPPVFHSPAQKKNRPM